MASMLMASARKGIVGKRTLRLLVAFLLAGK